jgi:ABC-2 type transport system permease protein
MSARPLIALVRKDLLVYAGDRRALIVSLLVPIILASFMALIFGGMSGDASGRSKIAVRVADLDRSKVSETILDGFRKDSNLSVEAVSVESAREDVLKGRAAAAVVLPKGFGAAAGRAIFGIEAKPELLLLRDPSHSAETGMVRGILMQHVMEAVTQSAFSGAQAKVQLQESLDRINQSQDMEPADRTALRDMLSSILKWQDRWDSTQQSSSGGSALPRGGVTVPFATKEEVVTAGTQQDERSSMSAHSFSGMVVQFVLFGAIEAGVGLLTERQRGLWKRLRSAPLSRFVLLGAKAISGMIQTLLVIAVVFGFGAVVFGVRIHGSALGFALVAVAYALTSATFGLLIAALGKTPQAARGVSILVVLLMVLLGGAWMPSFLFPEWLQRVTVLIPTRWAVDGFDGAFFRNFGLVEALGPAGALLGFSAVFAILTLVRFRWEAE